MARSSTISSKGQITVPLEVRKRLGVGPGDPVEFIFRDGLTLLQPARAGASPFDEFVGCLPNFNSVDESTAWVRKLRQPDESSR